jgi:hypothetical protein
MFQIERRHLVGGQAPDRLRTARFRRPAVRQEWIAMDGSWLASIAGLDGWHAPARSDKPLGPDRGVVSRATAVRVKLSSTANRVCAPAHTERLRRAGFSAVFGQS